MSKPISLNLINTEIGSFKDEMKGLLIQEIIFLGPKRYAYWYKDLNNQRVEQSIYAGIERNSLTFKYFKQLLIKINNNLLNKIPFTTLDYL